VLTRFVRVRHDGGARVGLLDADGHVDLFDHDEPLRAIRGDGEVVERLDRVDVRLLPPIEAPEIWCAGVTYERSRDARVEESRTDARDVYALVYDADRPELFMKDAQMRRTVGPGGPIRVRRDSPHHERGRRRALRRRDLDCPDAPLAARARCLGDPRQPDSPRLGAAHGNRPCAAG